MRLSVFCGCGREASGEGTEKEFVRGLRERGWRKVGQAPGRTAVWRCLTCVKAAGILAEVRK